MQFHPHISQKMPDIGTRFGSCCKGYASSKTRTPDNTLVNRSNPKCAPRASEGGREKTSWDCVRLAQAWRLPPPTRREDLKDPMGRTERTPMQPPHRYCFKTRVQTPRPASASAMEYRIGTASAGANSRLRWA